MGCHGAVLVAIEVNATNLDADYLMLNWRAENGKWHDYDFVTESFNRMTVKTSADSTDGSDGQWETVARLDNKRRDGVLVLPNNKPKWIRVRKPASHARLVRLDVFRPAPTGFRNDYWMFVGDSLTAADTGVDVLRRNTPSFLPTLFGRNSRAIIRIVLNEGKGGETAETGAARIATKLIPENPKGTFICYHEGANTISTVPKHAYPGKTNIVADAIRKVITTSMANGFVPIVSRIAFLRYNNYLPVVDYPKVPDAEQLGTLPYNLNVVDKLVREMTPYAYDFERNQPIIDPYTWFRDHQEALRTNDGVHHVRAGTDAMTQIWADGAAAMVYEQQKH